MQGTIDANLSTMSPVNMAILFVGFGLLLVILAIIVRKLGIKNLGPVKLEQHGQTTMYYMNEETKDSDEICRRQMRNITSNMKIHISTIFGEMNICTIARVAISQAIRFPLYESVANNHFTTELMPDNYGQYRERIIEMIRDEYVSLSSVSKNTQCNREAMPPWDEVSKALIGCIDLWLKRISREIILTCERKKSIYEKYLPEFEESEDDYRVRIVKNCIEKNERYITTLKDRIGREVI